jgi:hypothetical protein
MTGWRFRRRGIDPATVSQVQAGDPAGPQADPAESWGEQQLAEALAADVPDNLTYGDS